MDHRRIIHVDMDAFFASVEQKDDPSLKGRPLAVGGSRERGVVAAASYEARPFGVRSAMPMATARRLCPDLVVVPPRFERYREISAIVRGVFEEHTPLVEPMSLDEAYLDVTEDLRGLGSAKANAEAIRAAILRRTGLTASAGVSGCKFVAKIASDYRKPDGLFVVRPERAAEFVAGLPIEKFHGIGPATASRLKAMGVATGADLRRIPVETLIDRFGKVGRHYHEISWGRDDRPVVPDRERKSFGSERTFERNISDPATISAAMSDIVESVWSDRLRVGRMGRTVSVKVRYPDFRTITRSRTDDLSILDRGWLERTVAALLSSVPDLGRGVRLLGVSVSNLVDDSRAGAGQLAMLL